MPSSLTIYTVSITNSVAGVAPADGFIDNKRIEDYGVSLATTPSGLTSALSTAKRRANLRYREIINQLHRVANCYVLDASITGTAGTFKVENTSFSFQMYIERGGAMATADELVPGQTLTGIAAIKRCVARALATDLKQQTDIFDPTSANSIGILGAAKSVPRFGSRITPASAFQVAPYQSNLTTGESYVTVTAILT